MSFEQDLKTGKKYEQEILTIVKKKYPNAHIIEGYCKEGDIYVPEINEYVEVKYDGMSNKTGNIVVEVAYNGKPSALMTTKSYRWVFHTGNKIIIHSPKRLHKMIIDHSLHPATFTGRGDRYSKQAYLVKQPLIEDTAINVMEKYENNT